MDNVEMPKITELGNGKYHGMMRGHVLNYQGKDYKCSWGVKTITPVPVTVMVQDGKDGMG